jgi:hypothetical protein
MRQKQSVSSHHNTLANAPWLEVQLATYLPTYLSYNLSHVQYSTDQTSQKPASSSLVTTAYAAPRGLIGPAFRQAAPAAFKATGAATGGSALRGWAVTQPRSAIETVATTLARSRLSRQREARPRGSEAPRQLLQCQLRPPLAP